MALVRGAVLVAVSICALASMASAAPIDYVVTLKGSAVVPPGASTATSDFMLRLDVATHTLQVSGAFDGLATGTTASHLHCCAAAGTNAGVAIVTPTLTGFPLGTSGGTYAHAFDTSLSSTYSAAFLGDAPATAEARFAAGLAGGLVYLDIHTIAAPGGELRGQVRPVLLFGNGFEE